MALEARSEAWTVRHESVSYEDTSRMLTDWKKTKEYAYLREVSSVPLQQSLRHLQAAYRNFFVKTGDYPRVNLPDLTVGASMPFAEMIASGMAT